MAEKERETERLRERESGSATLAALVSAFLVAWNLQQSGTAFVRIQFRLNARELGLIGLWSSAFQYLRGFDMTSSVGLEKELKKTMERAKTWNRIAATFHGRAGSVALASVFAWDDSSADFE